MAYIYDVVDEQGVTKKITDQIAAWEACAEVAAFYLIREAAAIHQPPGMSFPFGSVSARWRATTRLAKAVSAWSPDVIYLRYDMFMPPLWRALAGRPVVVEINTDDVAEWRRRRLLVRLYNRLNRRVITRHADGVVTVTSELARLERRRGYQREIAVIANGLAPPSAPCVSSAVATNRAIFIGSGHIWDGVDRLYELATALPDVMFDVVGPYESTVAPPNVFFHGQQPPDEWRSLLARATVGIGPLALERKGLTEASPLKVRDYVLAGVPVVLAHCDTDLSKTPLPFVLQLEQPWRTAAAAARLTSFLNRVGGMRIDPIEAERLVGLEKKEEVRIAFMSRVHATHATAALETTA